MNEKTKTTAITEAPVFESPALPAHALEIYQARDYFVAVHNDMVQKQIFAPEKNAGNSLTTIEEKILSYLFSQIKPDATDLEPITLDIKTFCEVCGISRGPTDNWYPFLKSAITRLARRMMWLQDRETGKESILRYIDDAIIEKKNGKVEIILSKKLAPFLLGLNGNYFQYSYHNILAMKSKYGIMLYKILKSYSFRYPNVKFNIDDLKISLDATTASYSNFNTFKKKVLEPALQDINTFSDIEVKADYIKTGRGYTHVIFTIKDLRKSNDPKVWHEASRRYANVEKEINPDQFILEGYIDVDIP